MIDMRIIAVQHRESRSHKLEVAVTRAGHRRGRREGSRLSVDTSQARWATGSMLTVDGGFTAP